MITEDSVVVAADGIESAELEGEVVLLDINSGQYYGISGVGARIIELLKTPRSVQSIVEILMREYDVGLDQLRNDVLAFLNDMDGSLLIRILNSEVE